MNRKLLTAVLMLTAGVTILALLASSYRFSAPSGSGQDSNSAWTLKVDGLIQHPLTLTFDELVKFSNTTEYVALYCVDNPLSAVTSGNWTGVKLSTVLERAGLLQGAVKVAFYAEDGYSTDLNITTALRQDVILAYKKDGQPLTERLRLVVPGKWGYKWISKVTHIQPVDYDFKGTWESKGYPDEADI
jgi:DMSO/TMAO reductase YedYZ molybdopterin-dependent catalytic subunit